MGQIDPECQYSGQKYKIFDINVNRRLSNRSPSNASVTEFPVPAACELAGEGSARLDQPRLERDCFADTQPPPKSGLDPEADCHRFTITIICFTLRKARTTVCRIKSEEASEQSEGKFIAIFLSFNYTPNLQTNNPHEGRIIIGFEAIISSRKLLQKISQRSTKSWPIFVLSKKSK